MKSINKLLVVSTVLLSAVTAMTSCTKADYNDDFAKGDIPAAPGGYTSSKQIGSTDLVAYWGFNGVFTDSAGSITGTSKATTFGTGIKGQALQIADTGYYLIDNPGTVIPNLTAYTVSFWMKAPQNTSYGYGILSLNNPTDFWGSLDIYIDNGSTSNTAPFKVHMTSTNPTVSGQFLASTITNPWDKWIHMVVTYDNSTTVTTSNFNIYENGASVYSTLIKTGNNNFGALKFPNPTKMVIGTWQFQPTPSLTNSATKQPWAGSFKGQLDEFRIYKRPLTALEVSALFQLEKQGR